MSQGNFNVCDDGHCRKEEGKDVTAKMLADVEWLHAQMKTMGTGFNKKLSSEFVGQSVAFARGVLWERQRVARLPK